MLAEMSNLRNTLDGRVLFMEGFTSFIVPGDASDEENLEDAGKLPLLCIFNTTGIF